ncbi:SMP-30/gluconolactonase/LRE family protein [Mucilaginibacter sp. cycad4]|uniref:SMP-30/gluconolactonase/LRE family protein n=1 Tax=Mucilaginibacter sp. cycad4 TaxID=3342096 RepID=UPI002AABA859|nr:SMP-30/gluconolactonase/LRE family protein [Mucilaginibacter gossypii]WPV02015.1 SMP-30/gluconolactonase/LRE family protein [Mucilaginibacter gossypii]
MTGDLAYEVVVPHRCLLGEGPVWDAQMNTVCWVDIPNGEIHEFSLTDNGFRTMAIKDKIGAIALCTDGRFLAALKSGFAFIDRQNGKIKLIDHPEAHLPGNRFNDGKCDAVGRFWAGTMALSEETGAGSLYMIENDLSATVKIKGVSISNGLAWSPDNKIMYYIDTPTFEVVAYDYDIQTGNIANKRVAIQIPEKEGFPDGMTIDMDGMLWIAHWGGSQVARWDPDTGAKLLTVQLPVAHVTSCTFGGTHLNDLYITSARVGLSEKQLIEQPLAGSLFVVRNCGFRGMETAAFHYKNNI